MLKKIKQNCREDLEKLFLKIPRNLAGPDNKFEIVFYLVIVSTERFLNICYVIGLENLVERSLNCTRVGLGKFGSKYP